MQEITIQRSTINPEALDAELRTALGTTTSGFSTRRGAVIVHLMDDATPEQISQAQSIVEAHDPAQLTSDQQARAADQTRLAQLRSADGDVLDPADFSSETALLQQLAHKVALLEAELRDRCGSA
jgi:hypothetical protein